MASPEDPTSPSALGSVLVDFASAVAHPETPTEILHRLARYCTMLLPVEGAGVLLRDSEGVARFATANDELGCAIEEIELELREGPCLEALNRGQQIAIPDLTEDTSYPAFNERAVAAGLKAIYAVPLHLRDQTLGVVDLVASQPAQLGDTDLATAQMLADIAVAYVVNSRAYTEQAELSKQLQEALNSRVVIEQAKGRLSAWLEIDTGEAFEVLRDYARAHRRPLREVAEQVIVGKLRLKPELGDR
ncbi:ANTAR domain-containing protein [Egibacter rhizosphaerae]|nr:GAF and ANTAR domain-containing protein [Egibacter rhizosphaerae]